MLVKYIAEVDCETSEYGKKYEVISFEDGWYRLRDSGNGTFLYPAFSFLRAFKVLKQKPAPINRKPQLTDGCGEDELDADKANMSFSPEARQVLAEIGYTYDLKYYSEDALCDLETKAGDLLTYYATDDVEPDSPMLRPYYEILDYLAVCDD